MKNKIQKLIAFLLLTLGISFVSLAQTNYKKTASTQGEDVSIESLAINREPYGDIEKTRILAKNGVEFAITFPERYQNLNIVRRDTNIVIEGRKIKVIGPGHLSFKFTYTENGVSYICDILGHVNYYGELKYQGTPLTSQNIKITQSSDLSKGISADPKMAGVWWRVKVGSEYVDICEGTQTRTLQELLGFAKSKGVNGKAEFEVEFGDGTSNFAYDERLNEYVSGGYSLQYFSIEDTRTYKVNLSQEGQGRVSSSKSELRTGETVTLTAEAAQGWRFDHWEENGQNVTENPLTITMGTQDRSIKAVFTELPKQKVNVVLQIVDTNGGELAPSQSQEVTSGGSVTFQVPNLANVNFKGWKRNGQMVETGSSYTLSNVTQNETIQAVFEIPVRSLSLSFSTLSLKEGESKSLPSVTVVPSDAADQAITWTSNSPAVAKVENGKVVGLAAGTATLEASSTNGKKAVLTVTVSQREETQPQPQPEPQPQPRPEPQPSEPKAVESLSLSFSTLSLKEGESKSLPSVTVVPSDAADQAITWTSNSPAVAKVENGKVVGLAAGTATLEASSTNGKKAVLTVTVSQREETQPQPQPAPQPQPSPAPQPQPQPSEPKAVESLSLSFSTLSVKEGESKALPSVTVVPSDAADQAITWTSNSPAVAKVENGKVVGLAAGTATLEASSTNGKKAVLTVTVSQREETQPQPQPEPQPQPSPAPQPQPQPSEPSEQEALPPYIASFPTEVAPQEQISLTPWQGLGSIAVEQIRYHLTDADGNTLSQAIGKIENQKLVFTQAGTYRLVAELPNNPEGWTDIEYLITVK